MFNADVSDVPLSDASHVPAQDRLRMPFPLNLGLSQHLHHVARLNIIARRVRAGGGISAMTLQITE